MRKWLIAILFIMLFIISVMAGFIVRSFLNFSKGEEKESNVILAEDVDEDKETLDTSNSEVIVSPNAEVVITQLYKRCGHTIVKRELAPREIVNLNLEKVQEFYDGWNIDEFTANEIKISRTTQGICDEHYIISESDGYVSISCKNSSGEYIFKGLTDISVQYLPEEDLQKLKNGIEIIGRDNLNKFLEDFE